jgi:hypothetical protein
MAIELIDALDNEGEIFTRISGQPGGISRADLANDTAFTSKYVDKTAATTSGLLFVIDEDNMASNSATKVPTQQSVKAYIDNAITNRMVTTVSSRYVGYGTTLPVSGTEGDTFDLIDLV